MDFSAFQVVKLDSNVLGLSLVTVRQPAVRGRAAGAGRRGALGLRGARPGDLIVPVVPSGHLQKCVGGR